MVLRFINRPLAMVSHRPSDSHVNKVIMTERLLSQMITLVMMIKFGFMS